MSQYLANTVYKQFSNSATMLYLLACADQWIDISQFTQNFLANVWDIQTAVGFGLDIWGRILGVSRYINITAPLAGMYFGFNIAPTDVTTLKIGTGNASAVTFTIIGVNGTPVTPNAGAIFYVAGVATTPLSQTGASVTFSSAPPTGAAITWTGSYTQTGTNWQPWGQAPFYEGGAAGTVAYALPDTYYRQLLLVKAAANIATCDCPSLNALMRAMFGTRGRCYVGYDIGNPMNIAYHFEFFPTPVEVSIIQSGFFPQPAGTTVNYVFANLGYTPFGFSPANRGANPNFIAPWSTPGSPFYQTQNVIPLT
jgi:hypothetical protein